MTSEIPTDYYIIVSKFLPQRNKQAKAKKIFAITETFWQRTTDVRTKYLNGKFKVDTWNQPVEFKGSSRAECPVATDYPG